MDKAVLTQIGLTNYEAEVYLALLTNGQMSAYELAEKAGLYRQVTYDSLKRLMEKGFVSSVQEGKTKLFKAIDPKLILEFLNERTENYKQILPQLTKLNEQAQQSLSVETYKGKNVVRIALRDIIDNLKSIGGEILCTAVEESIPFAKYKTICDQYERDMIRFKIKERVIIKEGDKGIFQRGTSKYRKIPKRYFNPNPVQIYRDNVQTIVWGNPDYLIIIRNKEVAESYRKQFELMWNIARPYKNKKHLNTPIKIP
ncbi:MAG: helix-turn-helix domain-containing protein [Candidatus Woesearchaeota archaeon]|nr:helix-turn-helix domain-containing protein [Candidatus Woesearchaeota archaeon]